ncbi:MAG: large subunit ribosomal protein L13 [Chloroflexi bacterium]|jgi:large subunit ribosomal protein L13|nr:MAG: large subunit ribosomal protein L13 [Chloroflexota bacterium]
MTINQRKTYSAKLSEVDSSWQVVDAAGKPLGRLATEIARVLQGKHKAIYTPSMLTGDYVIVLNASQVATTGKKLEQKMYYRHSGYPSGLRATPLQALLNKHPERVIQAAVKGMLPRNILGRHMLRRLKVYPGPQHPHAAQVNANKDLTEDSKPAKRVKAVDESRGRREKEEITEQNDPSGTRKRRSK